jgi:hypothetical protein
MSQPIGIYLQNARMVPHLQINVRYHVNKIKDQIHIVIPIVAEKVFDKT